MSNKIKAGLSIFLMSVVFYMMITTRYTHALGDYLLEFIGLRPWTGNYNGLHLTVIYFGILFFISLFFTQKYAIKGLGIKKRRIFFVFVIMMIIFSSITGVIARNIKKNSSGLLAIGYNSNKSEMNYKYKDNVFTKFNAEFELTNYSNEEKNFYISIHTPFYVDGGIEEMEFYNKDGKKAIFNLGGNETKDFLLNSDNYKIINGKASEINKEAYTSGSTNMTGFTIILTDFEGNKIRLDSKNFFGIELGK